MKEHTTSHLVKSAELNHHGTLYAGRSAEWLVEAAFIAAAVEHGRPQDILCVNVHGFIFKKPVEKGTILTFHSQIARLGNTSITVHVKATSSEGEIQHVDGFLTFVCVEPDTKKRRPHGLVLDKTEDSKELEIRERAASLPNQ